MFQSRHGAVRVVASIVLAATIGPVRSQAQQSDSFVIGVVVLSDMKQGEENSGSVVTDPQKYQEIPALRVVLAEVPKTPAPQDGQPATASLEGVVVDLGDGRKQPADKPLTWIPPLGQVSTIVSVLRRDRPSDPLATTTLPVDRPTAANGTSSAAPQEPTTSAPTQGASPTPQGSSQIVSRAPTQARSTPVTDNAPPTYSIPSVVVSGSTEVIHGDSGGNSSVMRIAIGDTPATIVAARPRSVYWNVPNGVTPGEHRLTFEPGNDRPLVTIPVFVVTIRMTADRTELLRGQSTKMHVTISGLEHVPPSAWQAAMVRPELMDVKRFEERAAGFHAPKASDPGVIVVVIENRSVNTVKLGRGNVVVLQLRQKDFTKGPYVYEDKIESLQSGGFSIDGRVVAFLKNAVGQPAR